MGQWYEWMNGWRMACLGEVLSWIEGMGQKHIGKGGNHAIGTDVYISLDQDTYLSW